MKCSSPHFHSSNGKAESAVKVAKRLIKKTDLEKSDLDIALLEWRNTPERGTVTGTEVFVSQHSIAPSEHNETTEAGDSQKRHEKY